LQVAQAIIAEPSHLSQATIALPLPWQTAQDSVFFPVQRSQVILPAAQFS